ncbi:hypothetical protein D3OALGA1CA_1070 [Olavius algarvensis associated proteobacterium Delta 3]|nr:hypothetical protein D3OALGA1CA_1070 [Olavius algarvensis associated proteobacterium Delta 3]CAB5139663.1 hypothetical protein D3OALGB2SA_4158 [Olavius algarvensis associated proteobacterium Delta 3]
MKKKISLLLPTRDRPDLLRRLFHSLAVNTEDPRNVEILLRVDEDDQRSLGIRAGNIDIVEIVGPRDTMGAYNTDCMRRASGDIMILMNDDLVVRTPLWDNRIRSFTRTVPDGIFLAYPEDMESHGRMCTFPILSRRTCELLADPYPMGYDALNIDQHIYDVFLRLRHMGHNRMFFLDKVIFEHAHFVNGIPRADASYGHKNRYLDSMVFIALRHQRQVSAMRLRSAIENTPLPPLPAPQPPATPPSNLLSALVRYFQVFMLDHGLPLSRRLLLYAGFTKYFAAMKSGMGFLRGKFYTIYGG